MIDGSEIGYIHWTSLNEDDCKYLINYAQQRLDELAGEDAPTMAEYRTWAERNLSGAQALD